MRELVGRARELELIEAALVEMRAGTGGTLLFSGEPGSGKTSLLDAARGRAGDALVLSCRGVEWEAELPFSGLHELLRPLLGDLEPLPEPQRDALDAAFGVTAAALQPLHLYAGALSLLLEVTRTRPVLLLVDDLQWIDAPSAQALSFVARRIVGERLALIVATRPGPELPGLARPPVGLAPLDRASVGAVAERELGVTLPASAIRDLTDASGGNPLAVVESVRSFGGDLAKRGSLLDQPLPVGELIDRGFSRRLEALSPGALQAAEVAAASVSDRTSVVLAALGAASLLEQSLDELEIAGIVDLTGGRVLFAHPLLRALVHRRCVSVDLRRWHAALAEASDDRALRAWHMAMATRGPDAAAADELDSVAEAFILRGGGLAAAQALARAAELTQGADERGDRLARAARAAHLAGRPEWSEELFREALGCITDPATRVRAEHSLSYVQAVTASGPDLAAQYFAMADAAEPIDQNIAATALCSAGIECFNGGARQAGLQVVDRLRSLVDSTGLDVDAADEVAWVLAFLEVAYGAERSGTRDEIERAGRRYVGGTVGAVAPLIEALVWIEAFDVAEALVPRAIQEGQQRQELMSVLIASLGNALVDIRLGAWVGRAAELHEAARVADDAGYPSLAAVTRLHAGWLRSACGDDGGAFDLEAAAEVCKRDGLEATEHWVLTGRGIRLLAQGDLIGSVRAFELDRAWLIDAGHAQPSIGTGPVDLAEAYAQVDRRADAEDALRELRDYHARTGRLWVWAGIALVEGWLANEHDFDARFADAVERARDARSPFLEARSQLAWGRRLRQSERRAEAEEPLRAAITIFKRLGADAWVEQARSVLGVARAAPASKRDPDALTPQERQVAELVAAGASNKDAAGELFLSPKTIEAHLSRIYRKLGITSRTQLAARLAPAVVPDGEW